MNLDCSLILRIRWEFSLWLVKGSEFWLRRLVIWARYWRACMVSFLTWFSIVLVFDAILYSYSLPFYFWYVLASVDIQVWNLNSPKKLVSSMILKLYLIYWSRCCFYMWSFDGTPDEFIITHYVVVSFSLINPEKLHICIYVLFFYTLLENVVCIDV